PMKKLLLTPLLVLPFLAAPAVVRAEGWTFTIPNCPWKVEAGCNAYFRVQDGKCSPQAGPWYLYWPLEAHFGPPAPHGFPYWPNPMTLPPDPHAPANPGPLPALPPGPAPAPAAAPALQQSGVHPVVYTMPVPDYWYRK